MGAFSCLTIAFVCANVTVAYFWGFAYTSSLDATSFYPVLALLGKASEASPWCLIYFFSPSFLLCTVCGTSSSWLVKIQGVFRSITSTWHGNWTLYCLSARTLRFESSKGCLGKSRIPSKSDPKHLGLCRNTRSSSYRLYDPYCGN